MESSVPYKTMPYKNPILPGFHPDPSICRVNDDYYLVNSTFEFWPGIPIYHSKNLVDWKLIGHALTRSTQFSLSGVASSGGVWAPTIRYHDGKFYIIVNALRGKYVLRVNSRVGTGY